MMPSSTAASADLPFKNLLDWLFYEQFSYYSNLE